MTFGAGYRTVVVMLVGRSTIATDLRLWIKISTDYKSVVVAQPHLWLFLHVWFFFADIWPNSVQQVVPLGSSKIKGEVDHAHAVKVYRGVELQLHSFFSSAVRGVGGHFDASAVNDRFAHIE